MRQFYYNDEEHTFKDLEQGDFFISNDIHDVVFMKTRTIFDRTDDDRDEKYNAIRLDNAELEFFDLFDEVIPFIGTIDNI